MDRFLWVVYLTLMIGGPLMLALNMVGMIS